MCVVCEGDIVDTRESVATSQDEWSQPVTRKGKKKAGGDVELIQAPGDTSSRGGGPPAGTSSVGRGTPRAGVYVCVCLYVVCVHVCELPFFPTAAQHTRENYGGSIQVTSDQQRGGGGGGGGRGRRRTQSSGRGRNRGERGEYSRGERGESRGERGEYSRGERGEYSRGERGEYSRGESRGEPSARRERDRERTERFRSNGGR